MRILTKIALAWLLVAGNVLPGLAQDDIMDEEAYVKTNIALTKFRILGVTPKQYAKCMESENYYEPDKKLKFILEGKTMFTDDGQGYDLVAGDGILTSNQLFNYTGSKYAAPGEYKETADYNQVLADESFAYRTVTTEKIIIKCKLKWVKCSELSNPVHITACQLGGWPFGGFHLLECDFTWEIGNT